MIVSQSILRASRTKKKLGSHVEMILFDYFVAIFLMNGTELLLELHCKVIFLPILLTFVQHLVQMST